MKNEEVKKTLKELINVQQKMPSYEIIEVEGQKAFVFKLEDKEIKLVKSSATDPEPINTIGSKNSVFKVYIDDVFVGLTINKKFVDCYSDMDTMVNLMKVVKVMNEKGI